jgi:hypothetical protein
MSSYWSRKRDIAKKATRDLLVQHHSTTDTYENSDNYNMVYENVTVPERDMQSTCSPANGLLISPSRPTFNFTSSTSPTYETDAASYTSSEPSDDDIVCGADGREDKFNLQVALKHWAVDEDITMTALKSLLEILRNVDASLPKDPRTLLNTPQNLTIKCVEPGSYHHFGLQKGLVYVLSIIPSQWWKSEIDVYINIDGIPLFNSSTKTFWAICGRIAFIDTSVFVIGLYYGEKKPLKVDEFLKDLIDELKKLENESIIIEGKHVKIVLSGVCCDTPARCFVKCCKYYTGDFGCDRCIQKGRHPGRQVFLETDADDRTDVSFRDRHQPQHHHEISPFEATNIDMITAFPNDYMHSVCEGVGKKLLKAFRTGPLPNRLSSTQFALLDADWMKFYGITPQEFSRQPRSLQLLGFWKATEFRLFLLYVAPAILKPIISDNQTQLWKMYMCFFVSIFSMCHPVMCKTGYEATKNLLKTFIAQSHYVFGEEFVTYNVHSLLHLADDCRQRGPCDEFSCFPFENFLRFIKKTVKSSVLPLNQAVKRIMESGVCLNQQPIIFDLNPVTLVQEQTTGFMPEDLHLAPGWKFFKGIQFSKFLLSGNDKDCFFMAKDNNIYRLNNVLTTTSSTFLVCNKYSMKEDHFTYPMPSSQLGIFAVSSLHKKLLIKFPEDILCKMCFVPLTKTRFYASPILHTFAPTG